YARKRKDQIEFVTALFDVRVCAQLKTKGKQGAVAITLRFNVCESTAPRAFDPRQVGSRNLYIKAIATAIGFVTTQRMVRGHGYSRTFRRIARLQGGHARTAG